MKTSVHLFFVCFCFCFFQCSKSCGRGRQNRTAECMDNFGEKLEDRDCRPSDKLSLNRHCNTFKCPWWTKGNWTSVIKKSSCLHSRLLYPMDLKPYLSVYPFACLSGYLYLFLFVGLPSCLPDYLSVCRPLCLIVSLFVGLFDCLSVCSLSNLCNLSDTDWGLTTYNLHGNTANLPLNSTICRLFVWSAMLEINQPKLSLRL